MSERKIEALWDCSYCGKKRIGGLTKTCPGCGHPQDENVKFYLAGEKHYLDEKTAKQYGRGADWVCDFCGSYNRYNSATCTRCGSDRAEATKNYFGKIGANEVTLLKRKKEYGDAELASVSMKSEPSEIEAESYILEKNNNFVESFFKNKWLLLKIVAIIAILAIVTVGLIHVFTPKHYSAVVASNYWERSINIEEYRTVKESDWQVPQGGRVYDSRNEIHSYVSVLDHYETVYEQRSREVLDHYDYHTEYRYIDNGDGTFTEQSYEVSTPVYKTEYYTVEHEEPVYVQKPVYKTKYYYEIERWVYDRTEKLSSKDGEIPCWPEIKLNSEVEREASRKEIYELELQTSKKTYKARVNNDEFYMYKIGQHVEIEVVAGIVKKIQ